MIEQTLKSKRLDTLRRRINDETYLHAAIQRLALVMSRELMGIQSQQRGEKAGNNEQRRKRRE